MSAPASSAAGPMGACLACARRSWLLCELSGPLDYCVRDRARFFELLALADEELVRALGGRRAGELRERYGRLAADELAADAGGERLCRHCPGYPAALASPWAPPMLEVAGGTKRLARLTGGPAVALVGAARASDYGMAVAGGLARGLAASGVTVVAALGDGIARAAHAGALEVGAGSVAVLGGGLRAGCAARLRGLYGRVLKGGCGVSELPAHCAGRCWGPVAGERIVGELAGVTVVVEAEDTPAGLASARIAEALGRVVAAVPGRVSSPLARGPHALLLDGARLVQDTEDVLELLPSPLPGGIPLRGRIVIGDGCAIGDGCGGGRRRPSQDAGGQAGERADGAPASPCRPPTGSLGPLPTSVRATFERVAAGDDTPHRLISAGEDPCEVLAALGELELMGLLERGDGGRYLPRIPMGRCR